MLELFGVVEAALRARNIVYQIYYLSTTSGFVMMAYLLRNVQCYKNMIKMPPYTTDNLLVEISDQHTVCPTKTLLD